MCWRHGKVRLWVLHFMHRGLWSLLPLIATGLLWFLITLFGRKLKLLFGRGFGGLLVRKVLSVGLGCEFELFSVVLLELLEHFISEVSIKLIGEATLNDSFDFLKDLLRKEGYPSLSHLL